MFIKVIFDLSQIPASQHIPLRDTLISAIQSISQSGPKNVVTHLCLALSGLALQAPFLDIIDDMIKTFGQNPEGVNVLLEFLTVFPEELSENSRIPVSVSKPVEGLDHPLNMTPFLVERRIQRTHAEIGNRAWIKNLAASYSIYSKSRCATCPSFALSAPFSLMFGLWVLFLYYYPPTTFVPQLSLSSGNLNVL